MEECKIDVNFDILCLDEQLPQWIECYSKVKQKAHSGKNKLCKNDF